MATRVERIISQNLPEMLSLPPEEQELYMTHGLIMMYNMADEEERVRLWGSTLRRLSHRTGWPEVP